MTLRTKWKEDSRDASLFFLPLQPQSVQVCLPNNTNVATTIQLYARHLFWSGDREGGVAMSCLIRPRGMSEQVREPRHDQRLVQ